MVHSTDDLKHADLLHKGTKVEKDEENKKKVKKEKKKKDKQRHSEDLDGKKGKKVESKEERKERKRKHSPLNEEASSAIVNGIAKALEKGAAEGSSVKTSSKKGKVSGSSTGSSYFYKQSASLTAVPESKINVFLVENKITVTSEMGRPIPEAETSLHKPILSFDHVQFPALLATALSKAGFANPTPVQAVTWPWTLSGKDMVGIAKTGSGKTLAFGIPSLIHIQNNAHANSAISHKPQVLVLSPTRELAMQIKEEFEKFGTHLCKSVCLYGGVAKHEQKKLLADGANIVIATPGRLLDLVEEGACDLSHVQFLVLDEADRMLDQGFEEAIRRILSHLPTARQTLMFSATWPLEIQRLSQKYLIEPVRVTVGSTDLTANDSIEQRVEVLADPYGKEARLVQLLKDYHKSRKNRILIFALYKKEAARLEQMLKRQGYAVSAIHGDLSQVQRTLAIERFKDGSIPLLIATDVAARGIDIPNVEYVINVTFPLTVEDYCHRIGRTGRAGKTGISHTFFTLHDKAHSGALINVLKQAKQPVPDALMAFGTTVKKKVDPNYGAFARDIDLSLKPTKVVFKTDSDSD